MNRIFTVSFWLNALVSAFITMLMFYVIKTVANKWQIPVVTDVANAV